MENIKDIMNLSFIDFLEEHSEDDTARLILSGKRYPAIDVKLAATIIEARKKIVLKVPEWGERFDLYYPATLAAEQASSFHTAIYKQRFIDNGITIDLTGGLGIDSYYMAQKAGTHIYIERNRELCLAAEHNFNKLGVKNITIQNSALDKDNISDIIEGIIRNHYCGADIGDADNSKKGRNKIDLIYLDPDRRGENNRRIYAISDCDPDITAIKDELFKYTGKLLVKASPMADIKSLIQDLPEATSIHILSIGNECKELLISMSEHRYDPGAIEIVCVNFAKSGYYSTFTFTYNEESSAIPEFATELKQYIYEPDCSILKAGAFKTISYRFGIEKLGKSTHLYTSDKMITDFPGKIFKIKEAMDFNNKTLHSLSKNYPKANISVRNFPISADQLRRKARIEDGGNIQLIGTTISNNREHIKKIVVCERL